MSAVALWGNALAFACLRECAFPLSVVDFGGSKPPPYHRVIPSGAIKRSRGISTEARKPRARYEHAELFLAKKLLCAIEVQRFYLDPATALPCGLLARQSLASQTSTPLRCAQDDTDGMKSRISGDTLLDFRDKDQYVGLSRYHALFSRANQISYSCTSDSFPFS